MNDLFIISLIVLSGITLWLCYAQLLLRNKLTLASRENELLEQVKKNLELAAQCDSTLLQRMTDKLNILASSLTSHALIVADSTGRIEESNSCANELFGYTEDSLEGLNVSELMPQPLGKEHHKYLDQYALGGEKKIIGTGRDVLCKKRSGDVFQAHISISESLSGEKKRLTAIVRDVSQQKEIEQDLKLAIFKADEASTVKSEFLTNMSHEIRTPLNGVMGMLELLKGTSLDSSQDNFVKIAYDSANSLLNAITSIMDFSKIESGKLSIQETVFDLNKVVAESSGLFTSEIAEKGIRFNCEVDPQIPLTLRGDANHLQQILVKLLSNAAKFTNEGNIDLRVSLAGLEGARLELKFAVADTGIGIAAKKLEGLFEPFTQTDSSSTRKYDGSGLGLTIASRLVELMGGYIGVESEEGRGTTLWFSLFFELASQEETALLNGISSELKVLVLGDKRVNRSILLHYLQCWNIPSHSAADRSTAIAHLEQAANEDSPFHVVLVDYQDCSSEAELFSQCVRENEVITQTKLVALCDSEDTHRSWNESNFAKSVLKPVSPATIYSSLRELAIQSRIGGETALADEHFEENSFAKYSKNILIVDDMKVNLRVGQEMLRKLGWESDVAMDGSQALEALSRKSYDLVLMDCQMPVMDGYTATREIRNQEVAAGEEVGLPIVAITAHAMEKDRVACTEAGMNDYLTKPFAISELETVLERWLS